MNEMPSSVFLQALGSEAHRLHPRVLRYVTGPLVPGQVGVGQGVFEVVGSRLRKLNLLARPVVGPDLLVTRHEHDVPFTVRNTPSTSAAPAAAEEAAAGASNNELRAIRTFEFQTGAQVFVDVLRVGAVPGTLQNVLGRAERVELELACGVTGEGFLSLKSRRAWIRLLGLRVRLPGFLSVRADIVDGYDEAAGRQTITATVKNPIMGTVLEYRGSFTYSYE